MNPGVVGGGRAAAIDAVRTGVIVAAPFVELVALDTTSWLESRVRHGQRHQRYAAPLGV